MSNSASNFSLLVNDLRPYLLRFAKLQLRDGPRAEDAVSETIVAALSKPAAFGGKSELKTYLVGILKYKILDQFRANKHLVFFGDEALEAEDAELTNATFLDNGHFSTPPQAWADPVGTLQSRQFFEVLDTCVAELPPQLSRIFMMREWLELSTEEICNKLDVTQTNLHVSLHRARMRLRACLEIRWFSSTAASIPTK